MNADASARASEWSNAPRGGDFGAHLFAALPPGDIFWLLAGGIAYTVGALIFFFEWPPLAPRVFGGHAPWHCCVLAGSACFFWMMVRYVAPLA